MILKNKCDYCMNIMYSELVGSRKEVSWQFFPLLYPSRCSCQAVEKRQNHSNKKFSFCQYLSHDPIHLKKSFAGSNVYLVWDTNISLDVFFFLDMFPIHFNAKMLIFWHKNGWSNSADISLEASLKHRNCLSTSVLSIANNSSGKVA